MIDTLTKPRNIKIVEIENEKVYLRKDFLGWRTIEPLRDPETGQFILRNFLSKKGFLTLGILLIIILIGYVAFQEQLANYKLVMENPCDYCKDCSSKTNNPSNSFNDYNLDLGGEIEWKNNK